MEWLTDWLNNFAATHPWVPYVMGFYLIFAKAVKDIRDVLDKTPETDDNWFEKFATFIGKLSKALIGIRPTAPVGTKAVTSDLKDAPGVEVKK